MVMTETPDDIIRRNIPRELPCKLTDEEFTRIAKQRATREAERDELKADLDKETRKRKDQIEELDDEIKKMGRELHTGFQDRTIKCVEVFKKGPDGVGYVHTLRTDNTEEVERRPATAHETQRYLPSIGTGGILDTARTRQRSAQDEKSVVPGDDVPADAPNEGEESDGDGKPKSKRSKKSEH